MLRSSFFHDLMTSILEKRSNISKDIASSQPQGSKSDLASLCQQILCGKGEVSEMSIAAEIISTYQASSEEEKLEFFRMLTGEYDIDLDILQETLRNYRETQSSADLWHLLEAAEPNRQEVFRRINRAPGATHSLVKMREDLFTFMRNDNDLKRVDIDFEHLFGSWFNRGFLVLQPIDWNTPAHILEKVIKYEAVHEISDWSELRRRLEPSDRRCYAFFHPAIPSEPLIFVEVALTKSIPRAVNTVLREDRERVSENEATTAVFYSISNCQKGLRGISFGNFLIKQVASELASSLPNLDTFVTLSPLPGFARWFKQKAEQEPNSIYSSIYLGISSLTPHNKLAEIQKYKRELISIAAQYLVIERHKDGLAVDPVARFHLGNGASLHAIHFEANLSPKGVEQSFGIMVNYRYDLAQVEANHEAYITRGDIQTPSEIHQLAMDSVKPMTKENKHE